MKPIIVSFENKKVVIFGGGKVGRRKAKFFEDEARVLVISKDFVEGFEELDVDLIEKEIGVDEIDGYIADAFLVVTATDNVELNKEIADRAKRRDVLVNRVGEERGDVILPSTIQNNFLIAISTLGKSPGFCKFLRKDLEQYLGKEFDLMVRLQSEIREKLKETIDSQDKRREILWKILEDEEIWDLLGKNFYDKAVNRSEKIIGEEDG
ncbi:hypothetical protein C9439_07825 [archaeon SCG-AAA382B04]|nr:hypothetical protein C9439_07825 [archaeon SCG-AAA382B04]